MYDVINDSVEENSDMCEKKLKEIHKRQSRFNAFNFTQIYQKLTKFDELTGILTDTGHDDFFQATPSED